MKTMELEQQEQFCIRSTKLENVQMMVLSFTISYSNQNDVVFMKGQTYRSIEQKVYKERNI